MNILIVAIYNHPELYPPTLNAIQLFSSRYEKIIIICRNNFKGSIWPFPENVKIVFTTPPYNLYEIEAANWVDKLLHFFTFSKSLLNQIKTNSPKTIILYDYLPLFSFYLIRKFIRIPENIWYHNHDTPPKTPIRKFMSITYWAAKFHHAAFSNTNIFSLPSEERKKYFPLDEYNGKILIIPNYPAKFFYSEFCKDRTKNKIGTTTETKLLYQGSLGPGHGFEEIIEIMNLSGFSDISLTLLGKIRIQYKKELIRIADKQSVLSRLSIKNMIPYKALPGETSKYHIGLAIHQPYNITYATGATASNKIYEYIALGLPVILYDSPHYRQHLNNRKWAFFWNLDSANLRRIIDEIKENYEEISEAAFQDFNHLYNFEKYFPDF